MSLDSFKTAGNAAFKANNFAEAVVQYTKALECTKPTEESSAALFSNRAASYSNLGKHTEALADAESCIIAKPAWVKGHYRKGVALEALKRLVEAEKAYDAALTLESNNEDIQTRLNKIRAVVKEQMKKKPQQCASAEEAKSIGNYHFQQAQYELAAEYYSYAIDKTADSDPNKVSYYNNRAACLTQTHNYPMVIADCNNCLELDPANSKARLRRAYAYKGLEKWKLALEDFQQVNMVQPSTQISAEISRIRAYL